ncbi:MAG: protease inhibitor I42 family protein [Anaerolineae bacterium]|nr:protease inhibitor I42 family protein [Anaerolineae bacterium]
MLNSRGAAGYEWQAMFDPAHVRLITKQRIVNRKALGAHAKIIFNFQPLVKGDYEINFILNRPWENTPIEQKLYLLHVV